MSTSLKIPEGVFRRRVIVDASANVVRAGVEDCFHHFELRLRHDGLAVTSIDPVARRTPWTLCPAAGQQLQQLVGLPIGADVHRRTNLPDAREHCTHWYELALLSMAHAARGGRRQYDITVPDRKHRTALPYLQPDGQVGMSGHLVDGSTQGQLHRDGKLLLAWDIVDETIVNPGPCERQNLRTLGLWAAHQATVGAFDDDYLEAVKQLRRGVHIAAGRIVPLDLIPNASHNERQNGACFAQQPQRSFKAMRAIGATRDFSTSADPLLQDFDSKEIA